MTRRDVLPCDALIAGRLATDCVALAKSVREMQVGSPSTMPDGYLGQVDDASSHPSESHHPFRFIAVPLERLVEQAGAIHRPCPKEHVPSTNLIDILLSHSHIEGPLAWPTPLAQPRWTSLELETGRTSQTPRIGMPPSTLHETRKPFLRRELVVIEKGDQIARRLRDTPVPCGVLILRRLTYEPRSRLPSPGSQLFNHTASLIRGAVVHHDDFVSLRWVVLLEE
jgi:hypothetical protein